MLKERNANRTHAECVWWKFVSILHVVKRISIEFISHFVELCHACKRNSNTIYTAMLWSYPRSENQWFHSFRICCTVYGMCWCAFDMYHWHIGTFTYVHWALQLKTKVNVYYVSVSLCACVCGMKLNFITSTSSDICEQKRKSERQTARIISSSSSVSKRALVLQSKTEKISRNSIIFCAFHTPIQTRFIIIIILIIIAPKKGTWKVFSLHSH